MTLIAAYNSDRCIGRCDAGCYNAEKEKCVCICGGANHGAGLKKAAENTIKKADEWMEEYRVVHPDTIRFDSQDPQLPLF